MYWRVGWRIVVLRADPSDLPYAPSLTAAAIAGLSSIYPAWLLGLVASRGEAPPDLGALLLAVGVVPTAGLVGACVLILRGFRLIERFAQFALAMSLVQGLAMLGVFLPASLVQGLAGPDGGYGALIAMVLVALSALPLFVLAWYGLAMSHVWARTVERGLGLGLLLTLLQNAGLFAAWFLGFAALGFSSGPTD